MATWMVILIGCLVLRRVLWVRRRGYAEGLYPGLWARRRGPRLYRLGRRRERPRSLRPPAPSGERAVTAKPRAPRSSASSIPETPVERLQREWIAGRLTDEEYERELDAVYADARWR